MTAETQSASTLAQQVMPASGTLSRPLVRDGVLVVAGSLFVALCAQISVPLPFSPVPLTAQTLGVLLVGSLIGPRLGVLAMLLYLVQGAIGLPFFHAGQGGVEMLRGATAGYLVGFPLAAALTGWLATRGWDRRVGSAVASMVLGNVVIYLLGVTWLATLIGAGAAVANGLVPFLVGDVLKIVLASIVLPSGWRLLGRRGR